MKGTGINKLFIAILAGISTLALTVFVTPERCEADEQISINVSPNIINLNSIEHAFGIHTGIPYSVVNVDTVVLVCPDDSVLDPVVCYADSRGYLVAKFHTVDLDNDNNIGNECKLDVGVENTFTLEGEKTDNELFYGAGSVLIIGNQAELQKGKGPKAAQKKWSQN